MTWKTVLALVLAVAIAQRTLRRPRRLSKLPKSEERVLVLGASSGVGRTVAHMYAERGARVCVAGRREERIKAVVEECRGYAAKAAAGSTDQKILGITADFADVDDMLRVRDVLQDAWQGVDTVIVAAGVSALRPLLSVAGIEVRNQVFSQNEVGKEGLKNAVNAAAAATTGNYVGPLVSAITLIPLLHSSSKVPAILLVSTLGAVIPPPTRTLYASTKAASLYLYRALSIEHPSITFTHLLPSTIEGDFRASAVDGGEVREVDPNKYGLKREDVARRCIEAVDAGERTVFMPGIMRVAHLLYWIWPAFVEGKARQKYNFQP